MYDSLTLTSRELITSRPKCFDTRARKGRAYKTRSIDTTTVCVDKNDISERAYQLERGGQWDKGKGCDTFAPLGPWLVSPSEIRDPQNLDLWLEVDGHRFQNGSTRTMIFGVAHLISYISQFMTLHSGDVISTGTPPGVGLGQKPPRYLSVGQTMRLGITGLGVQQQRTISVNTVTGPS
jgi:2-keto-4-pentenoate hydratase/2-oxohepta-3-ene-1,7-dioic acid hydratase in catechol pathway